MLGFHSSIPFEIKMAESKFSNNKHIQSEVGLADTGYGQGQVLVNPLHLACIYTSFCNDGNVLKPYLLYKVFVLQGIALIYWWLEKNNKPKWWGTVSVALLFFVQIFSQIIVFVGAFDLVFDFRNLSGKRTSKRA